MTAIRENKSATDDGLTEKEFATLQAHFALRGHILGRYSAGSGRSGFYSAQFGWCRDLPTIEDVRAFLAQIGGRP